MAHGAVDGDQLLARRWLARKETGARARESLAALFGRVRAEVRRDEEIRPALDQLCEALRIIVRTRPECPLGPRVEVICPKKHRPRGTR